MLRQFKAIVHMLLGAKKDKAFPYQGFHGLTLALGRAGAWPFRYFAWRLRSRWGPALSSSAAPDIVVILLSYARPQNLAGLVDAALACEFVSKVIVSNNNPEIDLLKFVRRRHKRLEIIQQPVHTGCARRVEIARDMGEGHYLCIDDDIYLWPAQICGLSRLLAAQPDSIHGITGEIFPDVFGELSASYRNEDRTVEVVNRVYAFTGRQARTFFVLFDTLRAAISSAQSDPSWIEDVLLSHSGEAAPRIHDLGPYIPDPTSMDFRNSMHGRQEIAAARHAAVMWLRERKSREASI